MTDPDTEKRFNNIEAALLKLLEPKPTLFGTVYKWAKPYVIPFVLGMIAGGIVLPNAPLLFDSTPTIKQAASGGAAIPFLKENPSPNPLKTQPLGSFEEKTDSLSTSLFEPPSRGSPPVDAGQVNSTRSFRVLRRR